MELIIVSFVIIFIVVTKGMFYFLKKRLSNPYLNKCPLPQIDDSRWRFHDQVINHVMLFHPPEIVKDNRMVLGMFQCYRDTSSIYLNTQKIGNWPLYTKAVYHYLQKRNHDELVNEALKQLEQAE